MLQSEAEEAGLWIAIAEAPQDESPRLIFADWLSERNDPRGLLLRERRYWQRQRTWKNQSVPSASESQARA
jgi:uncharacterized protein (TIGR02996 family)